MTVAAKPRLSLTVQYAASGRGLPSRTLLRRWARAAIEQDATVTVRLVGSQEGLALNRGYRKKNYATNVLTFVFRDAPPFEGDLVLCAPVVLREARTQRKTAAAHYAHLTVHGLLHLQGYDHENARDAGIMEQREIEIMAKLGYADPYESKG